MPHTITETVYEYDELNDAAKARARDWYREGIETHDYAEYVIEDAVRIAAILGIQIATHPVRLMNGSTRQDPTVYWELHVQGAGACFEGTYYYAKGAHRKIRQGAPEDKELHAIADTLRDVQRRYSYSLSASITHRGRGAHKMSADIQVDRTIGPNEVAGDDLKAIEEALRDFMDWIHDRLEAEYEYQTSDEQVEEAITGNEYTFTAEGERKG